MRDQAPRDVDVALSGRGLERADVGTLHAGQSVWEGQVAEVCV
jgi:hypothetical protein